MINSPDLIKKEKNKLTREQQAAMDQLSADYRKCFSTPEGKRVMADLHNVCMTFAPTMTGNSWTYHNEGKRFVGLHIFLMREYGWEAEVAQLRKDNEHKIRR